MAEPSKWAVEIAQAVDDSDWDDRDYMIHDIAIALDAARRKGEADERKRCTILANEMEAGKFRRIHHLVQAIEGGDPIEEPANAR